MANDLIEAVPFSLLGQEENEENSQGTLVEAVPFESFNLVEAVPFQALNPMSKPTPSYVDTLREEYGRGFTQEDIINDDRLFSIVENDLMARYPDEGSFGQDVKDSLTWLAGGSTLAGWKDLSREDKFELWQNHQRSFAGGQSVTTLNEVGLVATSDDEKRTTFGAGYKLFDNMENVFTGDNTSWGDTFDAVRDYATAAIWDPTTVAGFGVGRALTAGGSKATAAGLKVAAQKAAQEVTEAAIQRGVAKTAAKALGKTASQTVYKEAMNQIEKKALKAATIKMGVKDFAAYGAVDLVASVGTDIAYQNVLIDTGAQDKYRMAQTAMSAVGVIALPALVVGAKGTASAVQAATKNTKLGRHFENYNQLAKQVIGQTRERATETIRKNFKPDMASRDLADTFANFKKNPSNFEPWTVAREDGFERTKNLNLLTDDLEVRELFWNTFLLGEPRHAERMSDPTKLGLSLSQDEKLSKGFFQAIADAGIPFVKRDSDDTISNFFGDVMEWLPQDLLDSMRKEFRDATGKDLDFLETPYALASAFRVRQAVAGENLAASAMGKRILQAGGNTKAAAELLKKEVEEAASPDVGHYVQSVWKRLLTSHLGTTALNIKGWGTTAALNSASDLVLGAMNFGAGVATGAVGRRELSKSFFDAGKNSILGSMRRGYRLLNPEATAADFEQLMQLIPKAEKELMRELAGDSGAAGAVDRFGLSMDSRAVRWTEKGVDKLQAFSGVKLQDEITKQISFLSAFDDMLLKKYGKTFNEFGSTTEGLLKLQGQEVFDEVVLPALDVALRETYSKSWSNQPGKSLSLGVGKFVEKVSNDPTLGYFIPFGRFFNSSMAMMGDYTGINFLRHLLKKATGDNLSLATESGAQLFAKGAVGWSLISYFSVKSVEKIENGLAWNQTFEADGSVKDITYDFPESMLHAFGQIGGHILRGEEVPAALREEVFTVLGGQTFRASEEFAVTLKELITSAMALEGEETGKMLLETALTGSAKIVSGFTRPLDPINTAAMIATEDYETADRRQGVKWWNETTRYVDKIFSENFLYGGPRAERNYPTRETKEINMGRVIGIRETGKPTPAEAMMNSVGIKPWQAEELKWDGPPEIKNRMDGLISRYLNTYAQRAIVDYPNFFKRPIEEREIIVQGVLDKARKSTREALKAGMGEADEFFEVLLQVESSSNKTQLERVKKKLGIEGDLIDLLKDPGAMEKMELILYGVKNYEDLFGPQD